MRIRKLKIFKTLIFLLIFSSTNVYSQKIALIARDFDRPMLFTDSVSAEQVKSGYFPIEKTNIDTFYANVKYLIDMLKIRQRAKMQSFELRSGTSIIKVSRVPYSNGDRYIAIAKNKEDEIEAIMPLISHQISNKKSAKRLQLLLDYLTNNKSLFMKPYGITPKIYNVVVITE